MRCHHAENWLWQTIEVRVRVGWKFLHCILCYLYTTSSNPLLRHNRRHHGSVGFPEYWKSLRSSNLRIVCTFMQAFKNPTIFNIILWDDATMVWLSCCLTVQLSFWLTIIQWDSGLLACWLGLMPGPCSGKNFKRKEATLLLVGSSQDMCKKMEFYFKSNSLMNSLKCPKAKSLNHSLTGFWADFSKYESPNAYLCWK